MGKLLLVVLVALTVLTSCTGRCSDGTNAKYFSENLSIGPDGKIKMFVATIDVNERIIDTPEKMIVRDYMGKEYRYDLSRH